MQKTFYTLTLFLFFLFPMKLQAQIQLGIALGFSKSTDFCSSNENRNFSNSCKDNSMGFKVDATYAFTPYIKGELAFISSGTFDMGGGSNGRQREEQSAMGAGGFAVAAYPIDSAFSLQAKLGLFYWSTELADNRTAPRAGDEEKSFSTTLVLGAAAQYRFEKRFGAKLEWNYANIGSDTGASHRQERDEEKFSFHLVSAGVLFYF